MSDHLPDCDDYAFSGAGYHPDCERICICRQVRRIEQRVRDEERERARQITKGVLLVKSHGFPDYDYYEFAAQTLQDCYHEIAAELREN